MSSEHRVTATLIFRNGGTIRQPAPYPLPEAVLQIAQVFPDANWTPGTVPASSKWAHRVFLLVPGSTEEPQYIEDTRLPEPTYENSSHVMAHCHRCKLDR